MPMLRIQTNQPIEDPGQLVSKASRTVAEQLGKPESYVMVSLEPNPNMIFAGSGEPLAYLELKSIGLPATATGGLSQSLCGLMQDEAGISPDRIYIEFADAPRNMWGWNSGTF